MAALFTRLVCASDGSLESLEAARQAARLAPKAARLVLLGVARPHDASSLWGVSAPARHELAAELRRASERISELGRARIVLLEGTPVPTLLAGLRREGATLVALGIRHRSRLSGATVGSVATAMLHDAPCSVYVGRGRFGATRLPGRVVVGFDGSPGAERALAAALALAERIPARVRVLVAEGGRHVDAIAVEERLKKLAGIEIVSEARRPADALLAAGADLLVLGSRGVHGLRTLGSVSERVAHEASCPVLVLRDSPPEAGRARYEGPAARR